MEKPKSEKKRELPPLLRKLLIIDEIFTDKLVKYAERFLPLQQLKVHYRVLEISAHGIIWFAGCLASIWILANKDLYQMQVNLFIGLLLDVVFVAVIKALTRRRRPAKNDDPFGIGPDKYSFPSGHASRSAFLSYFFINLWSVPIFFYPSLLAWTTSICISRLLMRRHHIVDVTVGILLGLIEGILLQMIYLNSDTCINLVYWVTDEKLDGGEYHV